MTWGLYNVFAWFGTEAMLIIVCGSAPSLHPLWERFLKRRKQGYTYGSDGYRTHDYSLSSSGKSRASRATRQHDQSLASRGNGSSRPWNFELSSLTGAPAQPSAVAAAIPRDSTSWTDELHQDGIRVVREVDMISGRSHSRGSYE